MKNKIEIAVDEAKKYLKHPRDVTHDLNHHLAVWNNCKDIIKNEKTKVNPGLVRIATFWHDLVLEREGKVSLDNVKENVSYLKRFLPMIGFPKKDVKIVIEAIRHHEFRDTPTNLEGMILQDADKLDVLSKSRWDRTIDAFKSGEMPREKYISYAKTGLRWAPILESTFHFKYSRNVAHESIIKIFDNKRQMEIFKEVGLQKELDESKRLMNSFETITKRFLIRMNNIKINLVIYLKSMSR